MPGELIVYKDVRWNRVTVLASTSNASFQVMLVDSVDGKELIDDEIKRPFRRPGTIGSFAAGKPKIVTNTVENQALNLDLDIGSGNTFYSVKVSAKTANDSDVKTVLTSIQVDGKTIITDPSAANQIVARPVSVKSLETADLS